MKVFPVKQTSALNGFYLFFFFFACYFLEATQSFDEEVISHYQEKIPALKGEELWFAKYKIGTLYEKQGSWEQAFFWYLESYKTDSERLEPIWKISSHYRFDGQNDLSYIFAKYGAILCPSKKGAFEDPDYADCLFNQELSIVSFYTPFAEDGYQAVSDLLISKQVPWHIKHAASSNLLFYVQNLPRARYKKVDIELPKITGDETYLPMNPSICRSEGGYMLICRTVNYRQQGAKTFTTIDGKGIIRTRNFLLECTKDFAVISQREIEESLVCHNPHAIVQGHEDCRIFPYGKDYWFTCTIHSYPPYISLGKLETSFSEKVFVDQFTPLIGPDPSRCEKNWLPFVYNGNICVVYSSDPFVIYQPDPITGECEKVLEYESSYDFSRFRGSAAPIQFDDGYLMLIHEVSFLEDFSRVYTHRFVFLDKNFSIKKLSRPFTFKHQGVEFCGSMTLNHAQDELIMTIGIEDCEAYFVSLDKCDVLDLLRDIK